MIPEYIIAHTMNYAVIGKGFIFPRHKQAIEATKGKILLTCDNDSTKDPDFLDWLEMYEHPRFQEVETVVICTPNYLHVPMAREALLRGKRVICEKPFTIGNDFRGLDGINIVLQLRYHPQLEAFQKDILPKNNEINLTVKAFRDESFWNSWKGDPIKAGSVPLHTLGVHYFDLLIHLFGIPQEIISASSDRKKASGIIRFKTGLCRYSVEAADDRQGQTRTLEVNGSKLQLSDKDNLSYEDLHTEVYRHFLEGKGIGIEEAKHSINLINDLIAFQKTPKLTEYDRKEYVNLPSR